MMLFMAVQHPHEEVLLAIAHISERLCLFAKNKRSAFERVSVVTGGYTGYWISFSGTRLGRRSSFRSFSPTSGRGCATLTEFKHTKSQERRVSTTSCSQIAVLASAEHWRVSAGAQLSLVTSSRGASLGAEAPGQQASTCPWPSTTPQPQPAPRDDSEPSDTPLRVELCFKCKQSCQ